MEDDVQVPDAGNTQDDAEYLNEGTDETEDTGIESGDGDSDSGEETEGEEETDQEEGEDEEGSTPDLDKSKKEEPKENPEVKALTETLTKYEEIFASPEEALEASKTTEFFHNLDRAVMSGRSDVLLGLIQENDPAALKSFSKNFLPALKKLDRDAFFDVTAPVIRNVLRATLSNAQNSNDQNLRNSVQRIAKFLFNDHNIPDEVEERPDPERQKLEIEKAKHFETLDNDYKQSIGTAIVSEVDRLILDGLDPNNTMTERMKMTVLEDTRNMVAESIKQDRVFQNKMQSLINRAIQNGRKKEDAVAAYRFYLARFKALMPSARSNARKAVLPVRNSSGKGQVQNKVRNVGQGQAPKRDVSKVKSSDIDWSKTSDADFLNDKVTFRK